jgi:hypothetical protein
MTNNLIACSYSRISEQEQQERGRCPLPNCSNGVVLLVNGLWDVMETEKLLAEGASAKRDNAICHLVELRAPTVLPK